MASTTFYTSRAKQLPLAFVASLLIWLLLSLANSECRYEYHNLLPLIIAMIPIAILLVVCARVIRLLVRPDELVLTTLGWSITRHGRRSEYRWRDYQAPTKEYVSSGKGGNWYIRLMANDGCASELIPAWSYTRPIDDVLAEMQRIRAGKPVAVSS